jgi:hypothetical protein
MLPTHGFCPGLPQLMHAPASFDSPHARPVLHAFPEQHAWLWAPHVAQEFMSQDIVVGHAPPQIVCVLQEGRKPQALETGHTCWVQPHAPGVPPPPHMLGSMQLPQFSTVRATPQLSLPAALPQLASRAMQNAWSVSGVQPPGPSPPPPSRTPLSGSAPPSRGTTPGTL